MPAHVAADEDGAEAAAVEVELEEVEPTLTPGAEPLRSRLVRPAAAMGALRSARGKLPPPSKIQKRAETPDVSSGGAEDEEEYTIIAITGGTVAHLHGEIEHRFQWEGYQIQTWQAHEPGCELVGDTEHLGPGHLIEIFPRGTAQSAEQGARKKGPREQLVTGKGGSAGTLLLPTVVCFKPNGGKVILDMLRCTVDGENKDWLLHNAGGGDAWYTDHIVDWSSSEELQNVRKNLFDVHAYPSLLDARMVLKHLPAYIEGATTCVKLRAAALQLGSFSLSIIMSLDEKSSAALVKNVKQAQVNNPAAALWDTAGL